MNGRVLVIGFAAAVAVFAAALAWFQLFAFYERDRSLVSLTISGEVVPIADFDGIDSVTSPLKLRGCFHIDPAAVAALEPAADAAPLVAPFWFRCFRAGELTESIETGLARAFRIAENAPEGFDLMLAVLPDGRGYFWRQLNGRFR